METIETKKERRPVLKLAYSDIGIRLEYLSGDITSVIDRHQVVAACTGQPLHLEPSYAALILPKAMPEVKLLESAIAACAPSWEEDDESAIDGNISLCASLPEGIEVILQGYWLAHSANTAEGTFFVALALTIEKQLINIWEIAGTDIVSCTWPTGKSLSELGFEF
jgi:hypothetical protein